jgi:hypothetical protein
MYTVRLTMFNLIFNKAIPLKNINYLPYTCLIHEQLLETYNGIAGITPLMVYQKDVTPYTVNL